MWLLVLLLLGAGALLAGWRLAVSTWRVETPREAAETAWYRLNPPRSVPVGTLQQRIMRAAVGARVVSVRGTALVPSTFEVALHPEDLESIAGVQSWLGSELAAALEERAEAEGWQLHGRPVVAFVPDPERVLGRPQVRARHESRTVHIGDTASDPAAPARGPAGVVGVGWLRPLGDHDPIRLTASTPVVLGRGATATVDLGDGSVSRRHCELRPAAGGWVVADLDSANGTTVNGTPLVEPRPLLPGDELELAGRVRFVAEAFDPATAPAPETSRMPATRVISGPAPR
jgi:pSer/pThr/pTyr-binding forkhead associated (FHA) protein